MKRNYSATETTTTPHRRGLKQSGGRFDEKRVEENLNLEDPEVVERMKAASRPGAGHAALEYLVGDWRAEVTCWAEPGQSPQTTPATAKATWIMGGLFLQEDFQGEMMGKPFSGRTLIGYDNVAHLFKSVWFSDMQSSLFYTEGEGQNDNRLITLEGTASCPVRDRADIPMRLVVRVHNPDKRSLEMFELNGGEERKTMEIQYFRA